MTESRAAMLRVGGIDWREAPDSAEPTILILGGFLTSPPFYAPMRGRLLERGAAAVVVAPVWLPDWLLAVGRGLGPIVTRSGRALLGALEVAAASSRSRGAPLLVVGHSAGGMVGRLLTSPEPFEGRRLAAANHIGAIVTLGTPHGADRQAAIGRRLADAATDFADRFVPGPTFAPATRYLTVTSRFVCGRPGGSARERVAHRLYGAILAECQAEPENGCEGDGLVPRQAAGISGVEAIVLDGVVHGQLGGAPWYGSDEALDVWWPRAIEIWREALRSRVGAAIARAALAGRIPSDAGPVDA